MKFHFPRYDDCIVIQIKFSKTLYQQIKQIADEQDVLRQDAIVTLLEGAIEEYNQQYHKPLPAAPTLPQEQDTTDQQKAEQLGDAINLFSKDTHGNKVYRREQK